MEDVRIGIGGIGGMGSHHAHYLLDGKVRGATLTAVCDVGAERLEAARAELSPDLHCFLDLDQFLAAGVADAVLIATTHYHHPAIAAKCFERGFHVLTEKPAGVYTRQVREMKEVAIQLVRLSSPSSPPATIARSLRKSYYDSGGWRATWAGEGGGVLLNQAPHQLDLWQWCCGMPQRLRAFCYFGRYHAIEVEDDVTALVEYPNGATGVFVTSTGDAPGSNRLEVTGDKGKAVIEDGKLAFWKLAIPEREFTRRHTIGQGGLVATRREIMPEGKATGHAGITQNFVDAIRERAELLAPGAEGIRGLALANAMLLSAWSDDWAPVPPDEDLYFSSLQERIRFLSRPDGKLAGQPALAKGDATPVAGRFSSRDR